MARKVKRQQASGAERRDNIASPGLPFLRPMIQIFLNGRPEALEAELSITALLERQQLAGKRLAVERNGEIVPRARHGDTALADGDRVEIVVAVGGG